MSTPPSDHPDGAPSSGAADPGAPTDPDEIKADIEEAREQLGRTVDELSQRLDVPTRAKEKTAQAKDTAVKAYRENKSAVIGGGAGVVALLGLMLWHRRRSRRRADLEYTAALRRAAALQQRAVRQRAAERAARKTASRSRRRARRTMKSRR